MKEIWAKHLGSFWSPFFVWDGPSLNSRLFDFWSAQQYNAILFFRVKIQKGLGNLEKITSWNAKCPIFLGNFTPKTSNYCLKNRALGVPGPFNCWVIWCLGIHTLPGCKFSEDSSHKNTRHLRHGLWNWYPGKASGRNHRLLKLEKPGEPTTPAVVLGGSSQVS